MLYDEAVRRNLETHLSEDHEVNVACYSSVTLSSLRQLHRELHETADYRRYWGLGCNGISRIDY